MSHWHALRRDSVDDAVVAADRSASCMEPRDTLRCLLRRSRLFTDSAWRCCRWASCSCTTCNRSAPRPQCTSQHSQAANSAWKEPQPTTTAGGGKEKEDGRAEREKQRKETHRECERRVSGEEQHKEGKHSICCVEASSCVSVTDHAWSVGRAARLSTTVEQQLDCCCWPDGGGGRGTGQMGRCPSGQSGVRR